MKRTLLFITTREDPKQRSRSELLLCRKLLCAPKESFLFQRPGRIGIAARGDTPSWRRSVQLWDEVPS